jgi:hypothetical protein
MCIGLFKDGYFFTKSIKAKTVNSSNVEWSKKVSMCIIWEWGSELYIILGNLSREGVNGSMAAKYINPNGFSIENFRLKVNYFCIIEALCLGYRILQLLHHYLLAAILHSGSSRWLKPKMDRQASQPPAITNSPSHVRRSYMCW